VIPDSFKQDLLNRVDIVEVVSRYVQLKKAGANYQGLCPFHTEKSPSFSVSPSKQFYHCFGCGVHGNAIGFLMAHSALGYVDAVKELASSVSMQVPDERPRTREEIALKERETDLYVVMEQAMEFYRAELKKSPRAIEYLKGRGLTGEIAARFRIGYSPEGWQGLKGAFEKYEDKALVECGLVIEGEEGKRYDRFRDRVMFPILSARGAVIGFGGRVMGEGEPKYLNSPETPLFEKGREVYGLVQARDAIRHAGRVLVVEGYMDVVALAQHGVEYAVATLGTATTSAHVQKLFRLADTVVFCFDGDAAGRRAAWRALENTLPVLSDGKNARFLFLPEGEDPDDYVRQRGKASFEARVDAAVPLSDFLLSELAQRHPPRSAEGRAALVNAAKPLLGQIVAPVLSTLLRRGLAELAGLRETEMDTLLPLPRAASTASVRTRPQRTAPSLLREPDLTHRFAVPEPVDAGAEGDALAALVAHCRGSAPPLTTAGVLQQFAGSPHENILIAALTTGEIEGLSGELLEVQLVEGIRRYWLNAQKHGDSAATRQAPPLDLSPEETERARQRQLARQPPAGS
jgi:DNA primase